MCLAGAATVGIQNRAAQPGDFPQQGAYVWRAGVALFDRVEVGFGERWLKSHGGITVFLYSIPASKEAQSDNNRAPLVVSGYPIRRSTPRSPYKE
jgi:hypothetical protein